ncbi:helix-turn-helix domain-containing protein [Microbacterium terricola]|uniref:HTH cro/C1-type domain-containing protein n=1 Tax=Microbacterium terricola TaxID=344163 RepID=A0ABM8E103_9MICO|nr:helix-turn-helix transcriptional regulator [Microbacterium terricola]UYK40791.1 helix-turn-helix domain-containing protein [Microbacterium terricola]BDV31466.1 hypothetical protein Microterr_21260 [Microbacterium terricola]
MSATDTTTATTTDSVAQFAADLRRLRLDGGNPTLARLQSETGISRTVLSDAFSGKQVPSARTVDGIVRACGQDAAPWLDRRDALPRRRAEAAPTPPTPIAAPSMPRSTAVRLAVGTFAIGVLAGVAATLLVAIPL